MKYLLQLSFFLTAFVAFSFTHAAEEKTLDGTYDVELTIGDKVFHDILEVHGKTEPIRVVNFGSYDLDGTMTVPGAFTAPIVGTATFRIGWSGPTARFNFSIVANENGQQYNVYYDGMLVVSAEPSRAAITGRASVDDVNGKKKILGTFRAVQRDQ